ncbi:hypothetical protein FPHYL_12952 [Fusarium phyllophilum]|uniref:Uncharacterized protein n=1 Tax=Fusarium phyllophilum TaxID=47803 RepID=A0A8H5MPB5_9HYPO|nr:hypothetical protein FPHYL_12952 [Fusarium phyllophilum]
MENTTFKDAISAIDGLLAYLTYLDKTGSQMAGLPVHNPGSHRANPLIYNLSTQIERYWDHLGQIASTQNTPSLTNLFNSFNSSIQFYEVAIFTFRNVLVGATPDSLNAIFSLCGLSYIASCLQNHDNLHDIFHGIEVWRNAIHDQQERQIFSDLVGIVWPQVSPVSIDDTLNSQMPPIIRTAASPLSTTANLSSALVFDFMQEEWLFNGLSNEACDLDAVPDSSVAIDIKNSQPTLSSLQDLQGSAIVSNLMCFLTECGDLLHVFSGRGVTTKDLYSCIAFTQGGSEAKNVVNACVDRLKSDEASQSSSAAGILSIVERFVALGYLQTPEELRKYMLCVGRPPLRDLQRLQVEEADAENQDWFQVVKSRVRHVKTKHPQFQLSPDANGLA